MDDPRPKVLRLEELPHGVKFVRQIPNGGRATDVCIVECCHPEEYRATWTAGLAKGRPCCLLCKADDLLRSCLTIAHVPLSARSQATSRLAPAQAALF